MRAWPLCLAGDMGLRVVPEEAGMGQMCGWGHGDHGLTGTALLGQALALEKVPGPWGGVVPVPDSCLGVRSHGYGVWMGPVGRDGHVHGYFPRVSSDQSYGESPLCAGPCRLLHQLEASPLLPHWMGTGPGLCLLFHPAHPHANRLSTNSKKKGEAGRVWKGLWSQLYPDLRPLLALWPGAGCLSN